MFREHLQETIAIFQGNPAIAVGVLAVVAVLFYFRPKDMLKLVAFCLFMVVVLYLMTFVLDATDSGSKQRDRMVNKSKEVIGE